MEWRYIIKQLGMPPGILFLLLLLAWLLHRRRPVLGNSLFVLALGCFYALSLPQLTLKLAGQLETEAALSPAQWSQLARHADAIVVLGGGREPGDAAWETDQPSLHAAQRLRYAARLAKASSLPILVSGGLQYGQPPSEARILADSLQQDLGISARWLEEESRTTWENALLSAAMLHSEGIRHIVLVTDAWHMQRSRWSFETAGFTVLPAPQGFYSVPLHKPLNGWLPEAHAFWQNTQLLNEWLGLHQYRLFNRL